MGKRELLLVGVFVVLGIVVYQVSAPPADPARPGFSISRLINNVRREVRGRPESAQETRKEQLALAEGIKELRVTLESGPITITGEDRSDIESTLEVRSNGYDKAEAESLVKATKLAADAAGEVLIVRVDFPVEGRQSATLSLKVPKGIAVRIEQRAGTLKVDNVASLSVAPSSGEATITNIPGAVILGQRGRTATIQKVGSLRLNASAGAEVTLSDIAGDTNLTLQSAEVRGISLTGGLEIESRSSDVRLEGLNKLRGPVRVNVSAGELVMTGLATEGRIDARRTEVRIEMAEAAPLAVYNDGEPVELSLPRGGLRVDALVTDGRVSLDSSLEKQGLTVTPTEKQGAPREERVTGAVNGGGPTVTVRNSRADIVLRSAGSTDAKPSTTKDSGSR